MSEKSVCEGCGEEIGRGEGTFDDEGGTWHVDCLQEELDTPEAEEERQKLYDRRDDSGYWRED